MNHMRIKDYAAAHPSQQRQRLKPSLLSLVSRRWKSLVQRSDEFAAIPIPNGERYPSPLPAPAVVAPVPQPLKAPAASVPITQASGSVSCPRKKTAPTFIPRKSASTDLQSEIVDNPYEQRLQLLLQPKPDRKKAQQAIAGALTELILKNMGIRLRGTVKTRQAREDALYRNVGPKYGGVPKQGDLARPPTPPSQPKDPRDGECP